MGNSCRGTHELPEELGGTQTTHVRWPNEGGASGCGATYPCVCAYCVSAIAVPLLRAACTSAYDVASAAASVSFYLFCSSLLLLPLLFVLLLVLLMF